MGDNGQVQIRRSAYQQHADDTRGNMGRTQGEFNDADRSQRYVENSMNGGIGSEGVSSVRQTTSRHGIDLDNNVKKLVDRTSEHADSTLNSVKNAASKSFQQG